MRLEDRETIRSLFSVKEGTLGPLLLPKEGTHTPPYSNYLATVPHMHSVHTHLHPPRCEIHRSRAMLLESVLLQWLGEQVGHVIVSGHMFNS